MRIQLTWPQAYTALVTLNAHQNILLCEFGSKGLTLCANKISEYNNTGKYRRIHSVWVNMDTQCGTSTYH